MQCLLTIKGDGRGRYGKYKNDTTRTIKDWLIFNEHVYTKVLGHLKSCDVCDPVACYQVYLDKRKTDPKHFGETSSGLRKLVHRYDKLCKKKGIVFPQNLIHETMWRCGDAKFLLEYESKMTCQESFIAMQNIYHRMSLATYGYTYQWDKLCNQSKRFAQIGELVRHITVCPDEQELQQLLKVADVMLT